MRQHEPEAGGRGAALGEQPRCHGAAGEHLVPPEQPGQQCLILRRLNRLERHELQAVLLGGAAGVFVGRDELEMPLSFEGARAAKATLGSGVVVAFNETVDLADILLRIASFFRDESCGQCVPCRVGTVRQEEALHRMVSGRTLG